MTGLVDSGADITIMGGELFKRVAVATKLLEICHRRRLV